MSLLESLAILPQGNLPRLTVSQHTPAIFRRRVRLIQDRNLMTTITVCHRPRSALYTGIDRAIQHLAAIYSERIALLWLIVGVRPHWVVGQCSISTSPSATGSVTKNLMLDMLFPPTTGHASILL